jgi:hypothetical protein
MARRPFEGDRQFAVTSCTNYLSYCLLSSDIPESARIEFLELFPASSQVYLVTGATAVLQCMAGRPKSARKLRTVRSRRLHYFLFCPTIYSWNTCPKLSATPKWLFMQSIWRPAETYTAELSKWPPSATIYATWPNFLHTFW